MAVNGSGRFHVEADSKVTYSYDLPRVLLGTRTMSQTHLSPSNMIYLDHHATTPVDPIVFEAMKPYFVEVFGNAMSSQHSFGWAAKAAVEKAREQVAQLIGAEAREIVFTSGATESIHLAILGLLQTHPHPSHIITSNVEHKCTLEVANYAQSLGHELTILEADKFGQVHSGDILKALKPNTVLVSLIHGNNEIGSLNPVAEIGQALRERKVLFHIDAAQTVGKVPIDVVKSNIDLLSMSSHKLYGPKGVGALFVRQTQPRVRLTPVLRGGGQEKGLRGGTHNVPGIVGLGAACLLCSQLMPSESARLSELRDHMIQALREKIPNWNICGETIPLRRSIPPGSSSMS